MPPTPPNPPDWISPEGIPPLAPSEVQVWRIDLPVSPGLFAACKAALSVAELERAGRRKQLLGREHAILGRGVLRQLLAHGTGVSPATIEIVEGPNRKPQSSQFAFNIAHSGNVVLVALQRGGSIGVDVEQVNTTTPILEVAGKVFTAAEFAKLDSIADEAERRQTFFQLWTTKEAVVKADGRGLFLPLNSFEVASLIVIPQPTAFTTFKVHPLPLAAGYAAALATDLLSATPKLFLFAGR